MFAPPAAIVEKRSLNTSPTRRLIVEFAHRRRLRDRDFTFADVHRVCRSVLGVASKPNLNRHVHALIEGELIERKKKRNSRLWLSDTGAAARDDWVAAAERPPV